VVHSNASYRSPALTGDATDIMATIVDKLIDEEQRNVVQVDCKMANQDGAVMATAKAEIE
jgi:acyl dehydratase